MKKKEETRFSSYIYKHGLCALESGEALLSPQADKWCALYKEENWVKTKPLTRIPYTIELVENILEYFEDKNGQRLVRYKDSSNE